jgi:hypothetical protein
MILFFMLFYGIFADIYIDIILFVVFLLNNRWKIYLLIIFACRIKCMHRNRKCWFKSIVEQSYRYSRTIFHCSLRMLCSVRLQGRRSGCLLQTTHI